MTMTERGLCHAITRTLRGDVSPYRLCRASHDFDIFSVRPKQPDPSQNNPSKFGITAQNIHTWNSKGSASDSQLDLAVVPIIAGADTSIPGVPSPGSASILRNLFRDFEIPDAALSCFLANRIQFTVFPVPSSLDVVELLNFRQWTIAWRSNSTSGKTNAILLWRSATWAKAEVVEYVEEFLKDIAQTEVTRESIGLFGTLLCTRHVAASLSDLDNEAFSTERRLRQVIQSEHLEEANELGSLSAAHSWLASRAVRERSRAAVSVSYLDYLLTQRRQGATLTTSTARTVDIEALHLISTSLVIQAAKVSEDANMHLSTIYNLIAQRDQATNLAIAAASREIALQSKLDQANSIAIADASKRIAEEAKKDSSVMKMIAVVTMMYLPGTFIATCFSMGIFDWSASSSDVVNPRIWVYFVFTILFTMLTFACFAGWLWWQNRQPQKAQGGNTYRNGGDGTPLTKPLSGMNSDVRQTNNIRHISAGSIQGSRSQTEPFLEKTANSSGRPDPSPMIAHDLRDTMVESTSTTKP